MKLYLKQKVFSWGDRFYVYDAAGQPYLSVQGEVFSWGKKLHIYDLFEQEVAYIEQRVFSFLPKYNIYCNAIHVAEVVKEFTFFHQEYTVNGPDWLVSGNFWEHEYTIAAGETMIAEVSKEWFTWGDSYELRILEGIDPVLPLAVILVVDACNESA